VARPEPNRRHRENGKVFVASALDKDGPRGREAVARVMQEQPQKIWKVIELKREILLRGWAPDRPTSV
jgi:hypothetical protein